MEWVEPIEPVVLVEELESVEPVEVVAPAAEVEPVVLVEEVEPVEPVEVVALAEEAELPRLEATSCRKVTRSGLLPAVLPVPPAVLLVVPDVLFVPVNVLPPEVASSAETRLLKSDCKALSAVLVEEVDDVDEDELPLEPCSDSTAENRSCINFLNACRMLRGDSVELVDEVELVEEVESVVPVDEVEPVEVAFAFQFGCGPFGEKGVEIPIWLNACMMLCINVLSPPDFDRSPETGAPELVSLLFDCWTTEKSTV